MKKLSEDKGSVKHHLGINTTLAHMKQHAMSHIDQDVDGDVDANDQKNVLPDEINGTEKPDLTKRAFKKYRDERKHTRKGVAFESTLGEQSMPLDPVDHSELKKKFKDRKDKDINNDKKVDSTDSYLHNRRKTISKVLGKIKEESDLDEATILPSNFSDRQTPVPNKKAYAIDKANSEKKPVSLKKAPWDMKKEEVELDEAFNVPVGARVRYKDGTHGKVIGNDTVMGKPGVVVHWDSGNKGRFQHTDFTHTPGDKKADYAIKEEVEQIDELSKATLRKVGGKMLRKGLSDDPKADKHIKYANLASAKLYPDQYKNSLLKAKVPATEEVEQFNEHTRNTLLSVINEQTDFNSNKETKMKSFFKLREETSGVVINVPKELFEAALQLMSESSSEYDVGYHGAPSHKAALKGISAANKGGLKVNHDNGEKATGNTPGSKPHAKPDITVHYGSDGNTLHKDAPSHVEVHTAQAKSHPSIQHFKKAHHEANHGDEEKM